MKTKICSKCKQEKDIILFSKRKDSKDGYRNICKECDNKEQFLEFINHGNTEES